MDVASPPTVRTAARTTLGFVVATIFTAACTLTLATRVTGDSPENRDSHHPSAPGESHRSP
ncbi:hypothetical protein [Halococcus sediminicola]|uniref:hypothetical protein n=1 Tax=Halococcus sediminicola TaxID=1264579 RepID=UPI0012AC4D40|nr:hypothetical protein [Halococcus sediminicola]